MTGAGRYWRSGLAALLAITATGCSAGPSDGQGGCRTPQVLSGELVRHSVTDGAVVWRKNLGPFALGSYAAGPTAIAIVTGQSEQEPIAQALDAGTGKQLWSVEGDGKGSRLAMHGDVVYLGSGARGTVHARRLSDGKQLWTRKLLPGPASRNSGPPWTSLVAHPRGVLLISPDDGALYALDRDSGATIVSADLPAVVNRVHESMLGAAVDGSDLATWQALRGFEAHSWLATGEKEQAVVSDGQLVTTARRLSGGAIQIALVDGGRSSSWRRQLRLPAGRVLLSMPAPGVLLLHGGNRLRRLSPSTGQDLWTYDLPQAGTLLQEDPPTALPLGRALLVTSSNPRANGSMASSVDLIDAGTGRRQARARSAGRAGPAAGPGVLLVDTDPYGDPKRTAPRLIRPSVLGATFNVPTASPPLGPPVVIGDAVYVFASTRPVFCA